MSTLESKTQALSTRPAGDTPPRGGASATAGRRGADFDHWAHTHLHAAYDPVLAESIPADLLRLVEDYATEWSFYQQRQRRPAA